MLKLVNTSGSDGELKAQRDDRTFLFLFWKLSPK